MFLLCPTTTQKTKTKNTFVLSNNEDKKFPFVSPSYTDHEVKRNREETKHEDVTQHKCVQHLGNVFRKVSSNFKPRCPLKGSVPA